MKSSSVVCSIHCVFRWRLHGAVFLCSRRTPDIQCGGCSGDHRLWPLPRPAVPHHGRCHSECVYISARLSFVTDSNVLHKCVRHMVCVHVLQILEAMEIMLLAVVSPEIRCEWQLKDWQVALVSTVRTSTNEHQA